MRWFNKLMLLISAYVPLLVIMWMQIFDKFLNVINAKTGNRNIFNMLKFNKYIMKGLALKETLMLITLTILIIFTLIYLLFMFKITKKKYSPKKYEVIKVENKSVEQMWAYISLYIFPFITLNLTYWVGIGTFAILFLIICNICIKNNILYINPILYKYSIYSAILQEPNNKKITEKVVLLSKKSEVQIDALKDIPISMYKMGEKIYIEL